MEFNFILLFCFSFGVKFTYKEILGNFNSMPALYPQRLILTGLEWDVGISIF